MMSKKKKQKKHQKEQAAAQQPKFVEMQYHDLSQGQGENKRPAGDHGAVHSEATADRGTDTSGLIDGYGPENTRHAEAPHTKFPRAEDARVKTPHVEAPAPAASDAWTEPDSEKPPDGEKSLNGEAHGAEDSVKSPRRPFGIVKRVGTGVLIALAAIILAGLGFFHYEYGRLQQQEEGAYTDEAVIKTVRSDAGDTVLQASEEAMNEQLADLENAEVVKAEGEVFQDSDVYNILLIGTDDRTEKFSSNARGDTCILLSVNKENNKVSLVSFERGIGVPVLWGPYEGQWDWLTHTFRYGGPDMMVQEIRDNFKIDVNRYVRINIRTLVKVIDAVGGIDVYLNQTEADHLNHPEGTFTAGYAKSAGVQDEVEEVKPGLNHLNGATAMVYARTRAIDDDWHRIRRQRRVIIAAQRQLSELSAADILTTLDSIVPLIQTNLSEAEIANLMTLAPAFMGEDVEQMTVPARGTYGSMSGMDGRGLFAVDFETNAALIREQLYGAVDEAAVAGDTAVAGNTAVAGDTAVTGDIAGGEEASELSGRNTAGSEEFPGMSSANTPD